MSKNIQLPANLIGWRKVGPSYGVYFLLRTQLTSPLSFPWTNCQPSPLGGHVNIHHSLPCFHLYGQLRLWEISVTDWHYCQLIINCIWANPHNYHCSGQLRYVVKYKLRKMPKSLLKHHCYCPILYRCGPRKRLFVYKQRPFVITFMCLNWCSS